MITMKPTISQIKEVNGLEEVPEDQLQWLIDNSEAIIYKAGEKVFSKGDDIDRMFTILAGKAQIKLEQNGNLIDIALLEPQSVTGLLPYSRASSALGFAVVIEECQILITKKEKLRELATLHYELTEALVHLMTNRTRDFAKRNVQSEKMMALGKLSAGLAHELNNPISAISRNAVELKRQLGYTVDKFKAVMNLKMNEQQTDEVNAIIADKITNKTENTLSLMEQSEAESELEEWLEDQQIEDPYELTESFLDYDFDKESLQRIKEIVGQENFAPVLRWISNNLTVEKVVDEVSEAASRVDNLIKSVKSFTHMDQSPEAQKTDLIKGLNDTITILAHKIKTKNITVDRHFEDNLPQAKVVVGEINQVWTNLIDNAIDAMENGGHLGLKAYQNPKSVFISISDTGSGISDENISKIFDPFFTTKEIGKGVGMGLELVQRIVQQHKGNIDVSSDENGSTFTVCLPLN